MERRDGFGPQRAQRTAEVSAEVVVSSRWRVLTQLYDAVEAGGSPLLLTGEAGAGKTWLAAKLAGQLPSTWEASRVDLSSALDPIDLLKLIGHDLGLTGADRVGDARICLRQALKDDTEDGRRWLLLIDEAHRGTPEVWDELQVIVNQLGAPGGFAALVLIGQTELLRELARRPLSSLAASLSLHAHLMPLDLDETRDLLGLGKSADSATEAALEDLHRDARGNPAAILRLAASRRAIQATPAGGGANESTHAPDAEDPMRNLPSFGLSVLNESHDERESDLPAAITAPAAAPPLVPSKPPLRVEDGLVEVGWDGDIDSDMDPVEAASAGPGVDARAPASALIEEPVEDRYAALQAWTEWTENQARAVSEHPGAATNAGTLASLAVDTDSPDVVDPDEAEIESADALTASGLRAEPQHEFAPYSQLFTRIGQSKQREG